MVRDRMRVRFSTAVIGAGVALLAAGCSDQPEITTPHTPSAQASPVALQHLVGSDREFAELAQQVPGFAGMYFDEGGAPVVRLKDAGQRGVAQTVLSKVLASRGRSVAAMRFASADYDFPQLVAWRRQFPAIQGVAGVVSTGIDERANRLRFGVVDAAARQRVLAKLDELNIPRGAVLIDEVPPTRLYADLNSHFRPVPGGVRTAFWDGYQNNACTVGFTAYTYGEADMKFLTNSHCTLNRGQVDFTNFYNPTRTSDSYRIGVEVKDPALVSGGLCPAGYYCRHSDAIVATYSGATGEFKLARPNQRTTGVQGSITVDAGNPRINVTGSFSYPYTGETLDKIGITTGWTSGQVFETCTDIDAGGGIWLWCQDKVAAGAWHGDSGSPVFYYQNGGAVVVGLLWGGPGFSINDKVFYMSSISAMGADGIQITRVN